LDKIKIRTFSGEIQEDLDRLLFMRGPLAISDVPEQPACALERLKCRLQEQPRAVGDLYPNPKLMVQPLHKRK
jgi:hypothetical protein